MWPDREDIFWCDHPAHDDPNDPVGSSVPHSHVVVPYVFSEPKIDPSKKRQPMLGDAERIALRARVVRTLGLKGNAEYATSVYTNGFQAAMTYFKHVPNVPFHGNDAMKKMFAEAPPWVEKREHMLSADDGTDVHAAIPKNQMYKTLTTTNILPVMKRFARLNKMEQGFSYVFQELMKKTRWRLSTEMQRNRIPLSIVEEYDSGAQACAKPWHDRYMPYEYKSTRPF